MSNTKKVSALPSVSLQQQDIEPIVRTGSGFGVASLHVLLAKLLVPKAKICFVNRDNAYPRSQWLSETVGLVQWTVTANPGDVVMVTGHTSDTQQWLVDYLVVTEYLGNGRSNCRCFLLLLEGEPPLWGNTSSQ